MQPDPLKQYVYSVLHHDRHADDEITVFSTREKAMAHAKSLLQDFCRFPEDFRELPPHPGLSWIYSAIYSCEGDGVRVEMREVL